MPRKALTPLKKLPNALAVRENLAAVATEAGPDCIELIADIHSALLGRWKQKRIAPVSPSVLGRELTYMGYAQVSIGPLGHSGRRGIRLRPRWRQIALQANACKFPLLSEAGAVGRFIADRCEVGASLCEKSVDLYVAHMESARAENSPPFTWNELGRELSRLGFTGRDITRGFYRLREGLRLHINAPDRLPGLDAEARLIRLYIADRGEVGAGFSEQTTDLHADFMTWAWAKVNDGPLPFLKLPAFGGALTKLGFSSLKRRRPESGTFTLGLRLKPQPQQPPSRLV